MRRTKPILPVLEVQDAGANIPDTLGPGEFYIYHTHGFRQFMGTAKLHRDMNCQHLVHWMPERRANGRLAKVIMREVGKEDQYHLRQRCRTCWK